jgi:hypothetical protein
VYPTLVEEDHVQAMDRRNDGVSAIHAPGIPQRARERMARLPGPTRIAALAAIVSLALGTLLAAPPGPPAYAAPARPHALSCNGPCVGITNPVYLAQGQQVAEGPVGAHLTVEGANWPASTSITIWPAPDAATCAQQQAQPPDYAGQIVVNGDGNAQGSYVWPKAVNGVNQTYTLCAVDGTTTVSPNVQVNAPNTYTVLAANPPTLTVSPGAIIQGQDNSITVTGQNWFAPGQAVIVNVCTDASCTAQPIASQTIIPAQDTGTFQVTLSIPPATAPGAYFVEAATQNQALTAPPANSPPKLTISAPTPTPTPTPSPTPTPRPTPTPPGSGKGSNASLIVLLGTLSLLFLIGGIISLAVYTRSNV